MQILEEFKIYYKGKVLKVNKDYKIHPKTKQVIFLDFFDRRYIKAKWERVQ